MNPNASSLQHILVICAFVRVLEPAPAAHFVHEQISEIGLPVLYIIKELTQPTTPGQAESGSPMVIVGRYDVQVAISGKFGNGVGLVLGWILLVPDYFRQADFLWIPNL